MNWLAVALGGGLGSLGRYVMTFLPSPGDLPFITLLTNIAGAILIGFISTVGESAGGLSREALLFWRVGVCGGFTTFSTFSLETMQLLEKRSWGLAALYVTLSVFLCLIGVLLGKKLAILFR